jgi:NADH:ubiquinone oxidoreductase subunit F (NADH-binding)
MEVRAHGTEAAPDLAVNGDEGEPGTFKDRLSWNAARTCSSKAC